MNMKKTVLLGFALLFGTACAYAVTADEVAAAAEQAALRARMNQVQEEYKGFNPHLTQQQMKEIPALVQGVLDRLQNAGYISLTKADVGDGIKMYFEGVNFMEGYYTSEDIERMTGAGIYMTEGDRHQHALMYALVKVLPENMRSFAYQPADYPEVINWKEFHYLCQDYMTNIYNLLVELQACDWETFHIVMGNLM